MRCLCCNEALTDYELTLRHGFTMEFLEMCQECINSIGYKLPVVGRSDLMTEADTELSDNLMEDDELSGFDDGNEDLDDYWKER
jgi:uncharacterized metal-binding protein YceD (DUF177 family)